MARYMLSLFWRKNKEHQREMIKMPMFVNGNGARVVYKPFELLMHQKHHVNINQAAACNMVLARKKPSHYYFLFVVCSWYKNFISKREGKRKLKRMRQHGTMGKSIIHCMHWASPFLYILISLHNLQFCNYYLCLWVIKWVAFLPTELLIYPTQQNRSLKRDTKLFSSVTHFFFLF